MPVNVPAPASDIPFGNEPADIVWVIASPSGSAAATDVKALNCDEPSPSSTVPIFVSAAVEKVGGRLTSIAPAKVAASPEPFSRESVYGSFASVKSDLATVTVNCD